MCARVGRTDRAGGAGRTARAESDTCGTNPDRHWVMHRALIAEWPGYGISRQSVHIRINKSSVRVNSDRKHIIISHSLTNTPLTPTTPPRAIAARECAASVTVDAFDSMATLPPVDFCMTLEATESTLVDVWLLLAINARIVESNMSDVRVMAINARPSAVGKGARCGRVT